MNSYKEDLRLFEILSWLRSHDWELYKNESGEKLSELKRLLSEIDRINIREFVDKNLADLMEDWIKWDNKQFPELDADDQCVFFMNSELHSPEIWANNMFKLVPPFVKQGVKIPENLKKLYAESRRCFIYQQYNAAIVLSRSIIEVGLKKKIGLPLESKDWTAGVVLEKALEKKMIKDSLYWIGKKVITKADKVLHQGENVEYQETLNALEHTKEFLEELFG